MSKNSPQTIEDLVQLTGLNPDQLLRLIPDSNILHHRYAAEKMQRDAEEHTHTIQAQRFNKMRQAMIQETEYLEMLARNIKAKTFIEETREETMKRENKMRQDLFRAVYTMPRGCTKEQWEFYNKMLEAVTEEYYHRFMHSNTEIQSEESDGNVDDRAVKEVPGNRGNAFRKFFDRITGAAKREREAKEKQAREAAENDRNKSLPTDPVPPVYQDPGECVVSPGGGDVKQELKADLDQGGPRGIKDQSEEQGEESCAVHNGLGSGEAVPADDGAGDAAAQAGLPDDGGENYHPV